MLLYHGTSEHVAQRVHRVGLQPRKQHRGKANWQHAFAGNGDAVYLTDAYPTAVHKHTARWNIINEGGEGYVPPIGWDTAEGRDIAERHGLDAERIATAGRIVRRG